MNNTATLAKKAFSITLKITLIFFLVLGLLIPLGQIKSLVRERQTRQNEAARDVGSTWGMTQTVAGPVLIVPYDKESTEWESSGKTKIAKTTLTTHYAYFLPEKLELNTTADTQTRYRGIFKVLLYQSDIQVSGYFNFPNLSTWQTKQEKVHWDSAYIAIGLSDARSIKNNPSLKWDNHTLAFFPGNSVFDRGLEVDLPPLVAENSSHRLPFSYELKLNGSGALHFTPTGAQTTVAMQSGWNSPVFNGQYLPETRTITENGFEAKWKMSFLNRDYPQSWSNESGPMVTDDQIRRSSFGVAFDFPVDTYQISERSVKYGFLFIVLTFTIFFLFEVMSALRVHPIQYLFVGFAMCLFYVLLLALSEHFSFGISYLITASLITILTATYSHFILKAKKRALLMGTLQGGLYSYLYVLLQAEDYSLLMGSIGLLVILASIMFVTRHVDWYAPNKENVEIIN